MVCVCITINRQFFLSSPPPLLLNMFSHSLCVFTSSILLRMYVLNQVFCLAYNQQKKTGKHQVVKTGPLILVCACVRLRCLTVCGCVHIYKCTSISQPKMAYMHIEASIDASVERYQFEMRLVPPTINRSSSKAGFKYYLLESFLHLVSY